MLEDVCLIVDPLLLELPEVLVCEVCEEQFVSVDVEEGDGDRSILSLSSIMLGSQSFVVGECA